MAFFKFRKGGGDDHAAPAPAAESIEAMRTRARHRLIGAAVLVVIGVIGFPLLFDNQPRPISVDIPIEIPDKNTAKPLTTGSQPKPAVEIVESDAGKEHVSPATSPAPTPTPAPVAAPAVRPAPVTAPATTQMAATTPAASSRAATGTVQPAALTTKPASKPEAKPAEKPATKPAEKPASKPADKPADKPTPHTDDGAKAQALLEGKDAAQKPAATSTTATPAATATSPASAASGRFIVQVGAYADGVKAHEVRVTLEKAGIKTYAQVVETKDGKRYRVRVGPFASKAEVDKVAEKIRKLDLPAAILEL